MAKNSIGGFFLDLALQLDKNSFETGNKYIDGMTNGFNKLIGTARNASVVLATTAVASGAFSSAELKTAAAIGTSTEALDNWKAAANIAGVSSNGTISSMSQLANVMNHLRINGQGLEDYSKRLGILKLSINELKDLTTDQAFKKIFEVAQDTIKEGKFSATEVYAAVSDLIGDAGANMLIEIQRKGLSIDQFLSGAAATQFMTAQDHENGANFMNEVNTLKEELKSATQLLGTSVGAELEPYVKSISDWIKENKDDITNGIKNIAEGVGRIADKVAGPLGDAAKGTGNILVGAATGDINKISEGTTQIGGALGFGFSAGYQGISYEEAKQQFNDKVSLNTELARLWNENGRKDLIYNDLPEYLQSAIDKYYGKKKPSYIKDGIVRPDGTVTQVAPDDWVFAARNVGDLARAFIPQGMAAGAEGISNYSIVQNFTINGARDTAQVVRQQAYNGVRDGLLNSMNQSSRRLQQMSGTR